MQKAILTQDVTNTVLGVTITVARAGQEVTILENNGSYYEVAYYDGQSPSTTFYVSANQARLISNA